MECAAKAKRATEVSGASFLTFIQYFITHDNNLRSLLLKKALKFNNTMYPKDNPIFIQLHQSQKLKVDTSIGS
ncbi:hypothetical protein ACQP3J_32495, partial [Escherichia coli]